jgi:hypothetical protein
MIDLGNRGQTGRFLLLCAAGDRPDLLRPNFKYSHHESREFLGPARRRSLLLIAVRPRNSAIRCFLLYFQ